MLRSPLALKVKGQRSKGQGHICPLSYSTYRL